MNESIEKKRSAALGWLHSRKRHWTQRSRDDLSWTAAETNVAKTVSRELARVNGKARLERVKP